MKFQIVQTSSISFEWRLLFRSAEEASLIYGWGMGESGEGDAWLDLWTGWEEKRSESDVDGGMRSERQVLRGDLEGEEEDV